LEINYHLNSVGNANFHVFLMDLFRGFPMKLTNTAWLLALFLSTTGVYAAGGPMNEDLTALLANSQKAAEAGKQGDAETFVKESEAALTQAKAMPSSAASQRVVRQLKAAVASGKEGKLAEGVQSVEEAMTDMKKSGAPKFGGGT
jgi:enoyl-CoA hydratase/carnithine racemase